MSDDLCLPVALATRLGPVGDMCLTDRKCPGELPCRRGFCGSTVEVSCPGPLFGGAQSAVPDGLDSLVVRWFAAADLEAPNAELEYLIYLAPVAEAFDFSTPTEVVRGETMARITGLEAATEYHVVVRVSGPSGTECNDHEVFGRTGEILDCADYERHVQPIFDENCVRCHAGPDAPQSLRLDRYASAIAGSVRGDSIRGCDDASRIIDKIISDTPRLGRRMPRDGPPYLTQYQSELVLRWIEEGARQSCDEPNPCADEQAPTFSGVRQVRAKTGSELQVCWDEAQDESTSASAIRYDLYEAETSGAQNLRDPPATTVTGTTCANIRLGPGSNLCLIVRARDLAENRDENQVELCATVPSVACVFSFEEAVRPILASRCLHCHSGANPPRFLNMTTHRDLIAGGALGAPIVACNWDASLLNQKTRTQTCGQRMPFDGPPWLSPSQRSVLSHWVESGAGLNCEQMAACADQSPPVFAGLTSAVMADATSAELCWTPVPDAVAYDIYESDGANGPRFDRAASYRATSGSSCTTVPAAPGMKACYVVRARDQAGNRDANTIEVCLTSPDACVDYQREVQTIFSARCIQCHSGRDPPQGIRWDSYENALRTTAVRACGASGSRLMRVLDGCEMPRDTTGGRCSIQACMTPSRRGMIRTWLDQGASPGCPEVGCP